MCHRIESPFILIHLLKKRRECTIKDLIIKKHKIEKKLPTVFVDITKREILNTIACYPEIFKLDINTIKKNEKSNDFFEEPLINYFDNNIDEKIKNEITQILDLKETRYKRLNFYGNKRRLGVRPSKNLIKNKLSL